MEITQETTPRIQNHCLWKVENNKMGVLYLFLILFYFLTLCIYYFSFKNQLKKLDKFPTYNTK